jgi:hypothetical protein
MSRSLLCQQSDSEARTCAGCGDLLAEPRRKWCSERCRKRSYGDPCIDCGAKTRYGAERPRVPEPRCNTCQGKRRAARWADRYGGQRDRFVRMWRAGVPTAEIAAEFGWSRGHVGRKVVALRELGYDLPYRYAGAAGAKRARASA